MSRKVDFKNVVALRPENIKIIGLMGDRIIFEPIKVVPKEGSKILDQDGNPIENPTWDRWPIRGEVVYVGSDLYKTHPLITSGSLIFLEDPRAASRIDVNGEMLAMTRLSNILLVYKELEKKD